MRVVFETTDYGRIECVRNSDGLGTAYFFKDDYETNIDRDGNFLSLWQTPFNVMWPQKYTNQKDAILSVTRPCTIGYATPQ